MASQRQIDANRRNSRRSTGPKSQAGRRRAAQNARKHGLSIFSTDPAAINELAIKIAGPTQDPEILDCSSTIAAAELDLKRIRRVRASLFGAAGISGLMETSTKRSRGEQPFAARRSTLGDLQNIDRYERRAIARRDKALRRLLRLKRKIER